MNDEWAKHHLPLLFVSHPIKLVPFTSPCFTSCWTMGWDGLHLVPFRYVACSVPIVSPGPCDTELHSPSCLLALNKTLFVLFGVITFPWLLWLWGFLTERIISMSALTKKKKGKQPKEIKKKKSEMEKSELKFPMQSGKQLCSLPSASVIRKAVLFNMREHIST